MSGYRLGNAPNLYNADGSPAGQMGLDGEEYPSSVSGGGSEALARSATPNGGLYLGAAWPKKTRGGQYGRVVAKWGANVAFTNTASTGTPSSFGLASSVFPSYDAGTNVLKVTQNAGVSWGQQTTVEGTPNGYMPRAVGGYFSAGVWVYNPQAYTVNFELRFFNAAANHYVAFNAAVDPCSDGLAKFITFSPSQVLTGSWASNTDAITIVRCGQKDTLSEGAWPSGAVLYFGNVYADTRARPKFLLTFDDGLDAQRNPGSVQWGSQSTTRVSSITATNVCNTPSAHLLTVGQPYMFTNAAPTGGATGALYYVQTTPSPTTFTLATDAALANQLALTTGAVSCAWQHGGTQERSIQQLVESYGFRGSLFIVPAWLGTTGRYGTGPQTYMSAADVLAMWNDGWAVGSHSQTHPSNGDNAGLKLLGPWGYYLSNLFDNMPAAYRTQWSIDATYRRRATSATQASPTVVTFENTHKFLVNQPIVWTDSAPTGMTVGVTYYVATAPSTTTATFATDQGTLAATVNNTTGAWTGTANYRHPGSAIDDSAIYADVVACGDALLAMGITTAYKFFALPQGGWDAYVRSAIIRAGFEWVRGTAGSTGTGTHTIPVGAPSGGGSTMIAGGWMLQPDAIQTDAVFTNLNIVTGYVDDTISQGACGCNYHHGLGLSNLAALDKLCGYLQTKQQAGLIDVLTLDEYAKELGID